jgi:hypothetical protein
MEMDAQTMMVPLCVSSRQPLVAAPAKFGSAPTYRGAGTRVASTDRMGTRGDPSTWTVPGGADGWFLDGELQLPTRQILRNSAVLRCAIYKTNWAVAHGILTRIISAKQG